MKGIFSESVSKYNGVCVKNDVEKFIYPKILVLSGGGMKGITYIGAMKALYDMNMLSNITTFAGTSIGALICALIVLDYSFSELEHFSLNFQFELLQKINFDYFLDKYGIDNGHNVDIVVKTLIRNKIGNDNITLSELYKKTGKTLIITTTCIDDHKGVYLTHETEPDLKLYLALKMSMCIPFFYIPVKYKGKYYVDGGCTLHYPIDMFNDKQHELIGIYVSNNDVKSKTISSLEDYIYKLLWTIMSKQKTEYGKHTIIIPLSGISLVNFKLTKKKKKELVQIGYVSVMNHYVINV